MSRRSDDEVSVSGLFGGPDEGQGFGTGVFPGAEPAATSSKKPPSGISTEGVTREAPPVRRGYGKGMVAPDPRKFGYDRTRAAIMSPISFGASKADRLDASSAGAVLERVHSLVGIDKEPENVIFAFDKALFFEHTINGASLLQPGRGALMVGESEFELSIVKTVLGADQRRFFRAFADEITAVNREVLDAYDPHDVVAAERHGQLMQVAVERGLQKYPYLAHDSSDAGLTLSVEERIALMQSKRVVLESTVNNADKVTPRVSNASKESA